jgi:acyl-[acyl-carrier-protein]-phospholipid O-acyltransferase/long-chain-fatty-acid--[acyl-carrier-protein] ligase
MDCHRTSSTFSAPEGGAGPADASAAAPAARPALYHDVSFWGMIVTQFLGAFNDNLFKQLMLLLSLKVSSQDRQPVAMFVFSAPFLIFSGYAGYLADRFSKRTIIVWAKVAEIAVMLLGLVAFLAFAVGGFPGLLVVLFLMGAQSAFFGPSKYGILPEMLRPSDLPRANGVILMTTFLAIIFGAASAGILSDLSMGQGRPLSESAPQLWIASLVCVGIAVVGTCTSLLVRWIPAAVPNLRLAWSSLTVTAETRGMLWGDRPLLGAVVASSIFWLVAGVAQQAVNSLGKVQLELDDKRTSILMAIIGVGTMVGSVLAGRLSRGEADFRVLRWGGWGLVASLVVVSLPGPVHGHLLGFWGSLVALTAVGICAGLYAIPLQVFMQSRPPEGQKGRMIAVMNQANFAAILLSSGVYWLFDRVVVLTDAPRCIIFLLTALVMLATVVGYRPQQR